MARVPPLRPLHPDRQLITLKLNQFRRLSTEEIIASLRPGQAGSLKAKRDGTVLDGHHRLKVLRERGVDVDALPREVVGSAEVE